MLTKPLFLALMVAQKKVLSYEEGKKKAVSNSSVILPFFFGHLCCYAPHVLFFGIVW